MDTTGKALLEHWTWAVEKGLMNRNTGISLRSACAKVLPVLESWEELDVRSLDVEKALTRFVNIHNKDFKPDSLEAYKRRFRQAVGSFLEYADDPGAWQPAKRARRSSKKSAPTSSAEQKSAEVPGVRTTSGELKGTNLHEFEYPIREGVMARLTIPKDVSSAEMKRLAAWARTLAVDFELE